MSAWVAARRAEVEEAAAAAAAAVAAAVVATTTRISLELALVAALGVPTSRPRLAFAGRPGSARSARRLAPGE